MIWNFCIRRPVLTIVVFLILGIFGGYAFLQMPVQENPDVDFPIVSVDVVLPGAAPEVIESEIVDPLEAEINTIEGIKDLRSTAREQAANIVAEFELWRDIDVAAQDVRDAVERARRLLPDDAESPIVRKLDPNARPIMWLSLQGDERWDDVRLTEYADTVVKQRLETVRGVGRIQIGGARKYAVRIRLDPERLAAHQLTVQDVVTAVQENNVDIPSGRIEGSRREFLIQTRGQFSEAGPLNDIIVAYNDGSPVRLADVGIALDDVEDDRQLARFSGEMTVGIGVVQQSDANTVELSAAIRERMAEIEQGFPPGLRYTVSTDASDYIRENIADLRMTILFAATLVVLVVLAFLRSGRGTLVVALAIPTSLLIGLAVINVLGFTLNVLTMLALILVIGIVVDDAIVVLERSYRHIEDGADPIPAARVGTTEVAFPNIANSLALGAVFLPVAFTGGLIGRFFFEFGVTVAATVFASTFVALTLTPVLCSRLLRRTEKHGVLFRGSEWLFNQVDRGYNALLAAAFRQRAFTLFVGLLAFIAGILALQNVSREFAPMEDRNSFMIIFETPRGATMTETNELAKAIEAVLADTPEVRHQFLAIGLSQAGPGEVNRGLSFVRLHSWQTRDRHQSEVMQEVRERISEVPIGRAFVTEITPAGVEGSPVEVVLQNPDLDELAEMQEQVMGWMRANPDMYVGVRTDLELNNPQVDVSIDRDRASEMGISVADISNTMRFLFGSPEISKVERDAERYEIITDVIGRGELSPSVLRDVYVRNIRGDLVSLDGLVTFEETIGPSAINRFNRLRSATISAQTPPGVALGDAVDELEAYLVRELPPTTDYELAGQSQVFEESFYYLTITIVFSIIFIYLVLAAQFESFLSPLVIMTALPLATAGAFGSLWLLDMPLSIFAFIGLIMLMGLVTKNSILLIDYTLVLTRRGFSPVEAAKQAGRERFRPVVMTAISTVLGMTPIALGYGAGGEVRMPLGISVAFGLLTSTLLTLVIVPVVFTVFMQVREFVIRLFRVEQPTHTPATEPAT